MTPEQVQGIQHQGQVERWSYPQLFEALKAVGVAGYALDVSTGQTRFYGNGAEFTQPAHPGFQTLTISPQFNASNVKEAIARSIGRKITYPEFLAEIAAAGVRRYIVDMSKRSISYQASETEAHIEHVPQP